MPSRRNQDLLKIHNIQQLNTTEFERDKLVRFFDNSRFNVTFVNKNGYQIGFYYVALLKPKVVKTMQYRSKCSCRSINGFFWICMNWVEVQVLLPQSSKSASSLRLWRCVSFSKMLPSLIFIVVLMSKNKLFIFALLWRAIFSRAPIREVTRWWGLELQRKIGSLTKFEEMEAEMGICFPIHFLVSVFLKLSSCTQFDSK